VCQTIAKVVRKSGSEDLGLILKTAKGAGVHDAVTIALVIISVAMWRLRKSPPPAHGKGKSVFSHGYTSHRVLHRILKGSDGAFYKTAAQKRSRRQE
jgi:hypothetical protein